ncbi:MAG: OmpA family protein [Gemmatimonadetes bacterium]|nr:OmpA family protein [Gemmatimonadota bacterium]
MRHTLPISTGIAVVLLAAACGGGPPPPPPGPDLDSLAAAEAAEQALTDSIAQAQAVRDSIDRERVRIEADETRVREDSIAAVRGETTRVRDALAERVHYDYDRSNIRAGDAAILDQKLAILQRNPSLRIEITGHCDERGSDEYNIALGNRRALGAKRYLTDRGIAEDRITTSSRGEENPAAMGANEEAWAQNRRGEFTIASGGNQLRMPTGM